MSRIGAKEIEIPTGVTITVDDGMIVVTGPKGELTMPLHRAIAVSVVANIIHCTVAAASKESPALWGTMRAHIANMIHGVTVGWDKQLELQGVGYKAALKGNDLELALGFSHPVVIQARDGISFTVEKEKITVSGISKELVGHVAAEIRSLRKPEPYKGKGVRYLGEHVRRKVGKVVGASAE